jgi:hypothetical protein
MKIGNLFSSWKRELLLVALFFLVISVVFLFELILSSGDVAQGDWGIPLTPSAAVNDFSSRLFVHSYNGFGEVSLGRFGFPYFQLINAALAPLGFVGGAEIKIMSVFLLALGGITAYFLARSFRLGKFSSFLAGLYFMTTPLVFNWLMLGWIYYLIAYNLFPLMLLTTKKFIETNQMRYALINGLILMSATSQPAFMLVYPTLGFLFVLFECRGHLNAIRKALTLTVISLSVWFLTALSFFASYNNVETLSFYSGDYFGVIKGQFTNFENIINPIRLWGSMYNFQFETYFFHWLLPLSFVPIILGTVAFLWRPREKRVLFFFVSYLCALLSFFVYNNLQFFVFNLPFGGIFEAPSVFLVPASLGLALLIGYFCHFLYYSAKLKNIFRFHWFKHIFLFLVLLIVILVGIPWWSGQASGNPIVGPATKLNLYSVPSSYSEWSNNISDASDFFVLYVPLDSNVRIFNNTYFSQEYEGVNNGVFTEINTLPYVSVSNSSLFLGELMNGTSSTIWEKWGNFSIKYVVVYKNVLSAYNMSDILSRLSAQSGLVKVAALPNVEVFENEYAKPVVYADKANVQIVYHDPTLFKISVNSTTPFILTFNQVYSSYWRAWANGTVVPDSMHFKDPNGFNSWQLDLTGSMTIDLYYEPQMTYLMSMVLSVVAIVAVLLLLIIAVIRDYRGARVK